MKINLFLRTKVVALVLLGLGAAIGHSPAHAAGARFVPNTAGDEITDTETGLIWRRCMEGQTWNGSTCTNTPTLFGFQNALTQAKSVASTTGVAWRLPNIKELSSLVIRKKDSALMDTIAFPSETSAQRCWSSTPQHSSALIGGWTVDFGSGFVFKQVGNVNYAIRLVRSAN